MIVRRRYYWRLAATGLSFIVFGLGAFSVGVVFRVISLLKIDPATKRRWIKTWIQKGCLGYIRMMRTLGVLSYSFDLAELERHNRGVLVVANHPSLLDAIFLLALCKNLTCIAKGALYRNPFTAAAVTIAGYIPNDSEAFTLLADQKLSVGENILIFPEGTRNTADHQLGFKRGAANIVVMTGCDIVPILIRCQPRALQKGVKWYKIPDQPPHFSFEAKVPLRLSDCIDLSRPRTVQYRQLTAFLIEYYRQWLADPVTGK